MGWHLLLLGCFIAAGIGVTWPMTAKLADGQLPWNPDVASYVWALWWVAHQVAHLGNPFATTFMAAPVGIQLGFDTLMPLPGLIMTPVTLLWGPTASFAVLSIITPGLLCYFTYRAARLWLGHPGAIAAGALFGLSTMVTWQNLYHLNISIGTIFLPLTLEATIRLRRAFGRPGRKPDAAPPPVRHAGPAAGHRAGRDPGRQRADQPGVGRARGSPGRRCPAALGDQDHHRPATTRRHRAGAGLAAAGCGRGGGGGLRSSRR